MSICFNSKPNCLETCARRLATGTCNPIDSVSKDFCVIGVISYQTAKGVKIVKLDQPYVRKHLDSNE